MSQTTQSQDEAAVSSLSAYSQAYWKFCTFTLGIALLISLAVHAGGPGSAGAAPIEMGQPTPTSEPTGQQAQSHRTLSIGGFDTIDAAPAFVIVDDQGHRVGKLPMTAASGKAGGSSSTDGE